MQLEEVDMLLNTVINTCEFIEAKLSDCITFPYGTSIIGIVRVDSRSKTLESIRSVLEEFELYVGVSTMFDDFAAFSLFYKQADIALKYGIMENGSTWIHYFEEYCFSYMLDRCTEDLPSEMFFPPPLNKLIDHDRKKSTSYVATLRAYLENDMKPAKAMKALYIQRSTFLHRLDRINEIIGVDLENERIKTHLLLSFQLMDKGNAST
jgi:sugar diacid utilization regulator